MSLLYPAFLDLAGRRCLVIGESVLADEKAAGLAACGASVERFKAFNPGRGLGAFLIVADVDEAEAGRILQFGDRERIFVNIVDKPAWCSFILPAVVRRGELSVAVSTAGASPALAGWLRRRFESLLGDEYALLVAELRRTRSDVKRRIPDYSERKQFYTSLFDDGILEVARQMGEQGIAGELNRRLTERAE